MNEPTMKTLVQQLERVEGQKRSLKAGVAALGIITAVLGMGYLAPHAGPEVTERETDVVLRDMTSLSSTLDAAPDDFDVWLFVGIGQGGEKLGDHMRVRYFTSAEKCEAHRADTLEQAYGANWWQAYRYFGMTPCVKAKMPWKVTIASF